MTEILIDEIDAAIMPESYRRKRAVSERKQGSGSEKKYDFSTLFYQAIQADGAVVLVCPKLLNFEKVLKASRMTLDGRPVQRMKVRNFYRHSMVRLEGASDAAEIRIELPNGEVIVRPVAQPRLDILKGLNCEMLISKDNRLEWIEEHVTHHVRNHQMEGIVFIDNGSTEYGLEDVRAVLERCGLKAGVIMSMPYPWGGQNLRPYVNKELFLQTSAYNLAKMKYLLHARAVLRIDIDEVLFDNGQGNVFDLAVSSYFGFRIFDGFKRYPDPVAEAPFSYSDHTYREEPDRIGGGNWCLKPDGRLKNFQWRCHNLENFQFKRWVKLPGGWYLDCNGITTGWKSMARLNARGNAVPDKPTEEFFRSFPRIRKSI